ncbi:AAA family ATPase [Paraburkholderia caribensis]|uniref:AAA family ATPase n=1 Tax=Paraburkholderia caribensis TaxID=75105 RepID=UPI00078D851F|nr:AAA family ATPase [Paraburkholderia caribensis]AMV47842.1 hypothetical protein ATN79_45070 [Paraburkholderia caribensis]
MDTATNKTAADAAPMLDDFDAWLRGRHRWLQTAAARLIKWRRRPDNEEITDLADLCVLEASQKESPHFECPEPGFLSKAAGQAQVRLRKVSNVQGVNAIRDGATLDFGDASLMVIYGPNGTGKSGYARLLKQICGSKAKEAVHGNVFDKQSISPSARVHVRHGQDELDGEWTLARGPIPQLRHVHVFDASVASQYVEDKSEATYEPSKMRFVTSLIHVCDEVAGVLAARKTQLVSKLPKIPEEFKGTPSGVWLAALSAKVTDAALVHACTYTPELDDERVAGEAALAEKDIAGRLKAIERETNAQVRLNQMVGGWKATLDQEAVKSLIDARADALIKRKAATDDAEKVFAGAGIDGVGQPSWKLLWEKAREFSVAHAYPAADFPLTDDGARCVLCQQLLDEESRARLSHFETFVKGKLENDAVLAERNVARLAGLLPVLPDIAEWLVSASAIKLDEADARAWFERLAARRQEVETAPTADAVPPVDWEPVEATLSSAMSNLDREKKSLTALQEDGKRKELSSRVLELRGAQWLHQQVQAIQNELSRLKSLAQLDRAITLTSTAALTKKSTELSMLELRTGYQQRFANELKALGGLRLPVEPESRQQGKGKVTFTLSLKGTHTLAKVESILSEGERRIIALAAFLADVTGSGQPTPFIFDDPISSLDQDFEERVVSRLVELATQRQVIVFTHRLSLLTLIEEAVKKLRSQAALEGTAAPVSLRVASLRRLGNSVGLPVDLSVRDLKPEAALTRLKNETLVQMRKAYDASDFLGYEDKGKSFCSDFRIVVERCVENVLLNDVVLRFRRSLTTYNRIGALAKIQASDCALIDDLMTRYSTFEHSQADELPTQTPDLAQLELDLDSLAAWIKEFNSRKVE